MGTTAIIAAIDKELTRLHEMRAKITKQSKTRAGAKAATSRALKTETTKRQLSPEGRARIAAAQRKRWAAARKKKKA